MKVEGVTILNPIIVPLACGEPTTVVFDGLHLFVCPRCHCDRWDPAEDQWLRRDPCEAKP